MTNPITPPPPVGLRPRWLADEQRLDEVDAALERYRQSGIDLPKEWLNEKRDIEDRLLKHRPYAAAGTSRQGIAAASAQPVPVAPTDEELLRIAAITIAPYEFFGIAIGEYEPETECAIEVYGSELIAYARAVLARFGTPPPQPVWADIHYAWELEDAEGEWQAGGSANSLEDVQREGNRYLQTYAQDGSHKLIIQQHCVSTIEEVTND